MENKDEKVTMIDFKKEAFKRKVKGAVNEVKDKAIVVVKWGFDHPVEAASIITGASLLTRNIVKQNAIRSEQKHTERKFYEHSSGKWAETKRKLTQREQLEAERRHKENKETWTEIFADMGVLK